jgi:aconitate hydratase
LSGNRNFEGRINPLVKSNYLGSPLLVVAYALAGHIDVDFSTTPLGQDERGKAVFLKDIWPTREEIRDVVASALSPHMFKDRYARVFEGDAHWQQIKIPEAQTYQWDPGSTYIKAPPYFALPETPVEDILESRPLVILGDSITTDHISPAGAIKKESPAGAYLMAQGVAAEDFNAYGARRGNHEVMIRGTFANIRLQNEMVPGVLGGITKLMPEGTEMTIFQASQHYSQRGTPLVVVAGKEYGTGSSRDWAAKGTLLLGVKAVIAESFERIHRSNLAGMGVLPLVFMEGHTRHTLHLKGDEFFSIGGLTSRVLKPRMILSLCVSYAHGEQRTIPLLCRIDTEEEVAYFRAGGVLPYVAKRI